MQHIKLFKTFEAEEADFDPYDKEPLSRSEEIFGKQTRLQKQFNKIVTQGLIKDKSKCWAYLVSIFHEMELVLGINNQEYKAMQNHIVEGGDPVKSALVLADTIPNKSPNFLRVEAEVRKYIGKNPIS